MSSFELSFSGVINLCLKQQVKKKDIFFFLCEIHPFVFLRIIKIQFMLTILLFLAHLDDQDGQILL